jgi:hypothetical protein
LIQIKARDGVSVKLGVRPIPPPDFSPDMNHHHRATLQALFAHPISANLDFRKVVHLLEDLGAEVENKSGNRIGVKLNGHSAAFSHAQHDLSKDEVVQVRKFLESCGVTADKYPA